MTYGQQHGHPPYGPPYGQPGYGQGTPPPPPYGPPPHHNAPPQQYGSPQQYVPPQHHAPPGQGRPPRELGGGPPEKAPRRRRETPTGGAVFDEDERWAVPAYVGMFVSGFVAPVIVLAAKGRTSPFARFHAVQALNLFVAMFVCTFTALLLAYFKGPGWLPLVLAVLAADCFCVTRAAIGANRCEWNRLPAIVAWPIFR